MKKFLRKKLLNKRNEISKDDINNYSQKIFNNIENLSCFKKAKVIFIYLSFGSEVETFSFIKKYINNKIIVVPKIINEEMKLIQIKDVDNLKIGNYGILEPIYNIEYLDFIDIVITPSIAYDKKGYRLGYGKGYYDKYFFNNRYGLAIGVSFENMLIEELPRELHDKRVNILVTEKRIINIC